MVNLSFDEFVNTEFKLYDGNPVIKNPPSSFVIADPSVLTPEVSHDNKFHLFCHTFFGVYHYVSDDGIKFNKVSKIAKRAMRPNVNYINGTYYVFYEKTRSVIANLFSLLGVKWISNVYCKTSKDLKSWSEEHPVITNSHGYEDDEHGHAISNPFLTRVDGKYRMYYSCGQTFIKDCGFCEPTHISFAESDNIDSGFISRETPIISPDKSKEYLNLCSGCLKVYKLKDCFIGLQNGIFEKNGKSHSAIMLLKSDDGINFEYVKQFLIPQVCENNENKKWMKQYVYACCLTYYNGKLRLYFNARNVSNNLLGRESIGIFEGEVK